MHGRQPTGLGQDGDLVGGVGGVGVEADDGVKVVEPVEQKAADEVDDDQHVEAEDRPAGADLERGDGHGHRAGDERGGGGDQEADEDVADQDAAEDLRDREDRDAADEQDDDEEQAGQERPEDDLAVAERGGQEDVVGLAVLLLRDGPGGEHRGEQGDQPELEVGQFLEHVGRGFGQGGQAGVAAGVGAVEGEQDEQDEQAEVPAADEQIAAALAAGLDDPQQDGVAGEETPEVVGDAEHGGE